MVAAVTGTKKCSKCGEVQPFASFHARTGSRDGLHAWCKTCKKLAWVQQDRARQQAKRAPYTTAPYAGEYNAWLRIRGADTGPVTWTIRRAA
jgi:coenzyme F420-reducing hydrogenase beta subunit